MYTKTTQDIKVTVQPIYLPEYSVPEDEHYVWAYAVQVENFSEQDIQLINRYWHITDAHGEIQEVHGEGVIGKQPTIKAGESFEYASGTMLHSPSGIMKGHYEMQTKDGTEFIIEIPSFSLDSIEQIKRPN